VSHTHNPQHGDRRQAHSLERSARRWIHPPHQGERRTGEDEGAIDQERECPGTHKQAAHSQELPRSSVAVHCDSDYHVLVTIT